jgi:ketosteroid isomerase-like protein
MPDSSRTENASQGHGKQAVKARRRHYCPIRSHRRPHDDRRKQPKLVSLAVSDGDLDAAVAQYEPAAPLPPWADDRPAGQTIAETMAAIMRLRLPLDTRLVAALPAAGLTMLVCERRIDGVGPDGTLVRLHGLGCTVVRTQHDGSWRIAADAWQLTETAVG